MAAPRAALLVALGLLAACAKLGRKDPEGAGGVAATSTSAPAGPRADAAAGAPAAAHDAGTTPERLVLRAGYAADDASAPASSTVEIDRQGAYRLERRGDLADAGVAAADCTGALAADVAASLWKAIDGASFAPTENGFARPVAPPRQGSSAGAREARYSVIRILDDLSLVPADEAAARGLVAATRAAIAAAEKQSASSGTCTKLGAR